MNSNQLILFLALFAACAIAVQGAPSYPAEAPSVPESQAQKAQKPQDGRAKRLISVPVVATANSYAYSYLGAYPNSVQGVRYTPAVATAYQPFAPLWGY